MGITFNIAYHTHNTYEAVVTEALFELLVAPCENESQVVRDLKYRNSLGEEVFQHSNPFGFNKVCVRTIKHFNDFEFWMTATVEKQAQSLIPAVTLTVAEEQAKLGSVDFYIDNHLFLEFSKFTRIEETAKNKVLFRQPEQPVFHYLQQLNQYIYDILEFDPEPTHVHTTVNEVLELGRGVCQDYTHLFLSMARLNNIPCRYVSGYLNQGGDLVGAAVMHAWAEAYVPGSGWRGFDPTNNLLADLNHIKTAHGADYSDCSPIKGILRTTGWHHTMYGVEVIPSEMEEPEHESAQ